MSKPEILKDEVSNIAEVELDIPDLDSLESDDQEVNIDHKSEAKEVEKNIENEEPESNEIKELKKSVDENPEAAILCEAKENNPNYLAIICANKKFYEIFSITENNLIGKSYDFLFNDVDFDYSSEDQLEYIRLVKAVKDFNQCSIITEVQDHGPEKNQIKLKINFLPEELISKKPHAIFVFEKISSAEDSAQDRADSQVSAKLLKNLERALRNERLLREISYLIVSDLSIREIAENIARILCLSLKVDRCLIHDYRDGNTSFIIEHHNNYTKPMFKGVDDEEGLKTLSNYINFQNHFYEKVGDKSKKSSLIAVGDISSDSNFTSIHDICEKFSISSQIAITTSFNNKINGGLYIHQSEKRTWLFDEIEMLEMVADQFAIAVDRSDSIERVMMANHELLEKTLQLKEALKEEKNIRQMQSEFIALVSHEFKTPLQIIDSTRELIVRKLKNYNIADEFLTKSLDRIKSGIQRMNGLIHSTLNLAKMESGSSKIKVEKEPFDLKAFVMEIIDKNSNLAVNKNIKIITAIDDLPADFNGDQKLLDHAVTNVISNAIKYSKNDSTVKVLSKVGERKILIRVIDQGIGIPKDDLENIGKKFFRAKNTLAVAGTGIGLYLTKYFIELHGGSVLIESEINVGTSVSVVLPK